MYKRGIALLLSVLLLAAVFPMTVSAATEEEKTAIREQISRDYHSALYSAGKDSFGGYCGLMAGWQLYMMGVNSSVCGYNGNLQFDYYAQMDTTTGGHKVRAYSAEDYTLKEALYAATKNGKRDVYNMLVGFQWTNTQAGASYGHAVVVYGVIDGMVYFTESFQTSLGSYPGAPIVVSIDGFVDFFDDWTMFDGLIVFGDKSYVNHCTEYPSELFVKATQAAAIYSQPCTPAENKAETQLMRTVPAGERLRVTGLYENTWNQFYYQIQEDEKTGYIAAEAVQPVLELEKGSSYIFDGRLESGRLVQQTKNSRQIKDGWVWEQGNWYFYDNGVPRTGWFCCEGVDYYLQPDGSVTTGWKNINGQDRYFSDTGAMRTGWLADAQDRYYLMSNGAKATGWRTVDGSKYYFDENGVLQFNRWLTDDSETYYLSADGSAVTGWVDLQEGHFCFGQDGHLLAETVEDENGILVRAVNTAVNKQLACCAATLRAEKTN